MILVLAEPADAGALWLRSQLKRHLATEVQVVTPAGLVLARSIVHRLTSERTESCFQFSDGRTLRVSAVQGIINRITAAPTVHFARAEHAEREYAATELHAFLLGWLASLECPLLNSPAPESLAGPSHSRLVALHFAALAGLYGRRATVAADAPQPPMHTATGNVAIHFVLDGQVIGPLLPAATRDALILFARLWGARLVQIETVHDGGRYEFVSATSVVDFRAGGGALVHAIARVFSP